MKDIRASALDELLRIDREIQRLEEKKEALSVIILSRSYPGGPLQQRILEFLGPNPEPTTLSEIMQATGAKAGTVFGSLQSLCRRGLVKKVGKLYTLVAKDEYK